MDLLQAFKLSLRTTIANWLAGHSETKWRRWNRSASDIAKTNNAEILQAIVDAIEHAESQYPHNHPKCNHCLDKGCAGCGPDGRCSICGFDGKEYLNGKT